jgi:hypothetical protein
MAQSNETTLGQKGFGIFILFCFLFFFIGVISLIAHSKMSDKKKNKKSVLNAGICMVFFSIATPIGIVVGDYFWSGKHKKTK